MKRLPKAITQYMRHEGAGFLLEHLTAGERRVSIHEFVRHAEDATVSQWIHTFDTKRQQEQFRRLVAARCERSASRIVPIYRDVARYLRDGGYEGLRAVCHLVNDRYDEYEKHWDNEEIMFAHRKEFIPSAYHPAVYIVLAEFDDHVTSASIEKLSRVVSGINKHLDIVADDAQTRVGLCEESLDELGAACGKAELLRRRRWGDPVFEAAWLRMVNGG